jgi:hypothetical protein
MAVSSFRMAATIATFLGFPAATRRVVERLEPRVVGHGAQRRHPQLLARRVAYTAYGATLRLLAHVMPMYAASWRAS